MALFQQANSSLKKMQIYWNTIDAKGGFHETFEYLQLRIFILPYWNKKEHCWQDNNCLPPQFV